MPFRSSSSALVAKHSLSRQIELLSSCLRFETSPESIDATMKRLDRSEIWPHLVERSFNHLVVPLFFRRAVQRGYLKAAPADVAELLEVTNQLNITRNKVLHQQLTELAEAMDRAGIAAIALKGGAILLDQPLPENCCVMMSDIDLLVSSSKFDRAMEIGISLDYAPVRRDDRAHSVVLENPRYGSTIDLHYDLGPQRDVLFAGDAIGRAERVRDSNIWRLSPTDRAVHNIYHAQIQNRCHKLAILSLHQLCNLGMLIEHHGSRIDWNFVQSRFEGAGYRSAYQSYLYTAQRLLGIQASLPINFGTGERMHFRRMMAQLDWPWLHSMVTIPAAIMSGNTEDRVNYRRTKGLKTQGPSIAVAKRAIRGLRNHGGAAFTKFLSSHKNRFGRR